MLFLCLAQKHSHFYLLLTAIRGCVLLSEKRNTSRPEEMRRICRRRIFLISSMMLLLLDLSLITPIVLMALLAKPTNIGIHPAIAMAAYTTYKIIAASLHKSSYLRASSHQFHRCAGFHPDSAKHPDSCKSGIFQHFQHASPHGKLQCCDLRHHCNYHPLYAAKWYGGKQRQYHLSRKA